MFANSSRENNHDNAITRRIGYSLFAAMVFSIVSSCRTEAPSINDPFITGYFADPTVTRYDGKFYLFATIDPWGGEELAVFESSDFTNWKREKINWPTKAQCTSPTSGNAMVWAPSVVQGTDGKFYMYVSVGSEIWAGVSSHPLGPWKNLKTDNGPLISTQDPEVVHTIDADCFIDDDGQAYLYWGSGHNWINGHCMVVKLKPDMMTFDGEMKDITPPNYFEGPHMIKRSGLYYLMYSDGKCTDGTYKVRYSTAKTPYGPWVEGRFSPILETSSDSTLYGPGHHTIVGDGAQDYIVYHRISRQSKEQLLRELCIDSLQYDADGSIRKVRPSLVNAFQ